MRKIMVSAEALPEEGKEKVAAQAFQRLGFQVLSVSHTISLQGGKPLFEKTFRIRLRELSKKVLPGVTEEALQTYWQVEGETALPEELEGLVRDVLFPEPPEFF